jgi:hypothetical protein
MAMPNDNRFSQIVPSVVIPRLVPVIYRSTVLEEILESSPKITMRRERLSIR